MVVVVPGTPRSSAPKVTHVRAVTLIGEVARVLLQMRLDHWEGARARQSRYCRTFVRFGRQKQKARQRLLGGAKRRLGQQVLQGVDTVGWLGAEG